MDPADSRHFTNDLPAEPPAPPTSGVCPALLVVAEDAAARQAFAVGLGARGFHVDASPGGATAENLLASGKYALVAVDFQSLQRGGAWLDELCRAECQTPLLLLRTQPDLELPETLAGRRITAVVDLPSDLGQLSALVWNAIRVHDEAESGLWDVSTLPLEPRVQGSILLVQGPSAAPGRLVGTVLQSALPDYELHIATRLRDALEQLTRREPDAILTELSLRDARGVDTVRRLHERVPDVPVIVLANPGDEALALLALKAGAQDYLLVDQLAPDAVRRSVRFAIERQKAEMTVGASAGTTSLQVSAHAFEQRLSAALGRARRERRCVALLHMTLHSAQGSPSTLLPAHLLSQSLAIVTGAIREYDTLCALDRSRIGLIMEGLAEGSQVDGPAQRLLKQLQAGVRLATGEPALKVSAGIAIFPEDADSEQELARCAEIAATRSRARGPYHVEFFDEERGAKAATKRRLHAVLSHIVRGSKFVLQYEPQHDPNTDQLVGVEAQLHWRMSGEDGLSAAHFIPLLDERGETPKLTLWMLGEVCHQARTWRQTNPDLRVSLNLSPLQLADPLLVAKVKTSLAAAKIPANAIEFEVPESALSDPKARRNLVGVTALGIRLVVDGFGTDSPIASLAGLSVKGIKIWPKLTEAMSSRAESDAFLQAITLLAHSLKLEVSVLGVQSTDERDKLRRIGCDRAQGTLYGPPCPAAKLQTLRPH